MDNQDKTYKPKPPVVPNERDIIAGNKIIFGSGFTDYENAEEIFEKQSKSMSVRWWTEHLKYHTSYDWLMPVLKNIQKQGYRVSIHFLMDAKAINCEIYDIKDESKCLAFAEHVFDEVAGLWMFTIAAIKWLKEQKNEKA